MAWKYNKKGILVVEILIVIAIMAIAFVALLSSNVFSLNVSSILQNTSQASAIAQETIEAVKDFRGWTQWTIDGIGTFQTGVNYYPKISGAPGQWQLVLGEETIGNFKRKIVFEQVMRDSQANIVISGGTNDQNSRKAIATVSWQEKGKSYKVEIVTYITNWRQ